MAGVRGSLRVVGTGFLAAGQITAETAAAIDAADAVFYVVDSAATRAWIEGRAPAAESLADAYAAGKPRHLSYREMADRLLAPLARGRRVCAVFYGHPGVFVEPGHQAIRRARADGHDARMLPAVSAEDCLFADLGVDPLARGCQSFEATALLLYGTRFDPRVPLILWQIGAVGVRTYENRPLWSRRGLEILTERLAAVYPADHPVTIYEASSLPMCPPRIERLALESLAGAEVSTTSTLCVPPLQAAPERLGGATLERTTAGGGDGWLTAIGTGGRVVDRLDAQSRGYWRLADRRFAIGLPRAETERLAALAPDVESLAGTGEAEDEDTTTARLLEPLRAGKRVAVAVPGHPAIGTTAAHALGLAAVRQARAQGLRARLLPAVSLEGCLFADLGVDPGALGRALYASADFVARRPRVDPTAALILLDPGQDPALAGPLASRLAELYPPAHEAVLYDPAPETGAAAGIARLPIARLAAGDLRCAALYLPPLPRRRAGAAGAGAMARRFGWGADPELNRPASAPAPPDRD